MTTTTTIRHRPESERQAERIAECGGDELRCQTCGRPGYLDCDCADYLCPCGSCERRRDLDRLTPDEAATLHSVIRSTRAAIRASERSES